MASLSFTAAMILLILSTTTTTTTNHKEIPKQMITNHSNHQNVARWKIQHKNQLASFNVSDHHYNHLFPSQMERDVNRVASLVYYFSNENAASNYGMEAGFETRVASGVPLGNNEYLVRIGIGNPPQYQYMAIDTGSDITWVQCQTCLNCYHQITPIFNPYSSASLRSVPCGSKACNLLGKQGVCHKGQCFYLMRYLDGPFTRGALVFETFTFEHVVLYVALGCGHENQGSFSGFAGILGLGGGFSFKRQLGSLMTMSYCLPNPYSNKAGWLEFGQLSRGITWISLIYNPKFPTFYYVGLVGLGVGGKRVAIPASIFKLSGEGKGGVVFDSGTAVMRFPKFAYEALRDAFVERTKYLVRAPSRFVFDTFYYLPPTKDTLIPALFLFLGRGGSYPWRREYFG